MSTNKPREQMSLLQRQQLAISMALRNLSSAEKNAHSLGFELSQIVAEQEDILHREDMIAILGFIKNFQQQAQIAERLLRIRANSIKRRNVEDRMMLANKTKVVKTFADTISD